jgi:hypothetical protein
MLRRKRTRLDAARLVLTLACTAAAAVCNAGPREQAKRIHDRLTGTPPSPAVLDAMAAKVAAGNALGAAQDAMTNPAFYNTTVRELATPWTNRDRSVYADLNDSTATVIGMVRDDVPFDQVLSGDIVYVGSTAATPVLYSQTDNNHYVELQRNRVNLANPANLVRQTQSSLPGTALGAAQTAGIMTTRGFASAFLVAGTNRAAVRFAMLNTMCMDMEDFRDVTAWPDRIRQDVSRSPGGDSNLFLNDCLGCHAGLDGLAGGFAFYDFDATAGRITYTPNTVHPKFVKAASTFPFGFVTTGDSWINYWRTGPNAFVDWHGPGSGSGAKSLGQELAQTRQFSECQVRNVFEKVCYRKPNGPADLAAVETIANSFEANNRSLRRVFAETAVHCMGN